MNLFTQNGRTVRHLPAAAPDAPLLLTFLDRSDAEDFAAQLHHRFAAGAPFSDGLPAHFFIIEEPDWGLSFTPYPAPAAFKGAPAFGGGAAEYAAQLFAWLPEWENRFALAPRFRALAGYSLGGLFTVSAAYQAASPFTHYACVSGSLWYDGWLEKMQQTTLPKLPEAAYFSLGDREKISKNPRLAAVENNTLAVVELWRQAGAAVQFEFNPGGHFQAVAERMVRAAAALLNAKAV